MMQQYTSYQLKALKQLADFRSIFYDEGKNVRTDLLQRSINSFIELFLTKLNTTFKKQIYDLYLFILISQLNRVLN